jgi:hypothetical protein
MGHGCQTRRSTSSASSTARRSTTRSTGGQGGRQRFDFRGTNARCPGAASWASRSGRYGGPGQSGLWSLQGEAGQALDLIEGAGRRRPKPSGKGYAIACTLLQGIPSEKAKVIAKKIRDDGPRGVQAQIQGDQLRVSGKKRDDLQAVIALLKADDFGVALQFINYR